MSGSKRCHITNQPLPSLSRTLFRELKRPRQKSTLGESSVLEARSTFHRKGCAAEMQPKKSLQLLFFSFFAHNLEPTGGKRTLTRSVKRDYDLPRLTLRVSVVLTVIWIPVGFRCSSSLERRSSLRQARCPRARSRSSSRYSPPSTRRYFPYRRCRLCHRR